MPPVRGNNNEINQLSSVAATPALPEVQPPRPPNAWILYRSAKLQQIAKSTQYRTTMAEISKVIGKWWREETPEIKAYYNMLAKKAKEEHARKFPGYKFKPVKKEDKKKAPPKPRASSRSTSGEHSARSRAAPYHIPSATPAPAPVVAQPVPQPLPMIQQQLYAMQYQCYQLHGPAGPSPPMDAWDGDDAAITPLSLSDPESPEVITPSSSILEPSPASSYSPQLFPSHSSTPISDTSASQLHMPEIPADDMYMLPLNDYSWDTINTDAMTFNMPTGQTWSTDMAALFDPSDPNVFLLNTDVTGLPMPTGMSFDIDFANLMPDPQGPNVFTPEHIDIPAFNTQDFLNGAYDWSQNTDTSGLQVSGGAVLDFNESASQSPLQSANQSPSPVIEDVPVVPASKYQPPPGASQTSNRRVGGNWRPQVMTD